MLSIRPRQIQSIITKIQDGVHFLRKLQVQDQQPSEKIRFLVLDFQAFAENISPDASVVSHN